MLLIVVQHFIKIDSKNTKKTTLNYRARYKNIKTTSNYYTNYHTIPKFLILLKHVNILNSTTDPFF